MKRKRLTANQRADLFEAHNGKCWRCKRTIDPIREKWEVGHIIGLGCGGSDTIANLAPEHKTCNRSHGSSVETSLAAKIKRVRNKRLGAEKEPYRTLSKKMNGDVCRWNPETRKYDILVYSRSPTSNRDG